MTQFTPLASLFGGILIGLAAVALMLLNGRIAGISGITAGLLSLSGPIKDRGWRIAFVVGLVAGPLLVAFLSGRSPDIRQVVSTPVAVLAGLLVGYGTVLGNGCTSGHGVCGIARLSPRSIVATVVFMVAGIAATYVMRHLIGGD